MQQETAPASLLTSLAGISSDALPSKRWKRYVAIGDSLTEGLCDDSRQESGAVRGWADRLSMLLTQSRDTRHGDRLARLRYANVPVRSRTVGDVLERQISLALALSADLVTILIGANEADSTGRRNTL